MNLLDASRNVQSRQDLIVELIDAWRTKLGLGAWDIRYDPNAAPDEGFTANIAHRQQEMVAVMTIHPDLPEAALEGTIVHELLHLVLKPYKEPVERLIAACGNDGLRVYAGGLLEDELENVIEALSRVFLGRTFIAYDSLLPEWAPFSNG